MIKKDNTSLLRRETYSIEKLSEVSSMAKVLSEHIVKNKLSVNIVGKEYVMVEGWAFAGQLLGLYPRVVKVECIGPNKWMAIAEITDRRTNQVISTGYAVCSKEEGKKKSFDEYAILSMAQTRAIGKAYRNLIGWVIKMAGFQSIPAEEMPKEGFEKTEQKPKSKFEEMMSKLEKVKLEQLDTFLEKIKASKSYTDEQKNEFTAKVMELKQK